MTINSLPEIIEYVNGLPAQFAAAFSQSNMGPTPLAYKILRFESCLAVATEDEPIVVSGLLTDYLLLATTALNVDTFPKFTVDDYLEFSKKHADVLKHRRYGFPGSDGLACMAEDLYDITHQALLEQIQCDVEPCWNDFVIQLQEFYPWIFNAVVDTVAKGAGQYVEISLANVTSNSTL